MSRNAPQFPWRVVVISVLLFGAVAAVAWIVMRPRTPAVAASPTPGAQATADESADAAVAATQAATAADAQDETPPSEADPSTAEGRAALASQRAAAGTMDLQLFLIIPGLERLIPVVQTVTAPPTIDAQVQRAVEELINWASTDTVSPVTPQASVREVWVSPGGIAYLDFDRAFYDFSGSGSLGELHAVYGVIATLTETFPEIVAVQFLVEGETIETLSGHVDLTRPLLPSNEWVLIQPREAQIQESHEIA